MILGQFQWRGDTIEAEALVSDAGEVVWLHQLGDERIGIAVHARGRLRLTRDAPKDDMAQIELEAAYQDFRGST